MGHRVAWLTDIHLDHLTEFVDDSKANGNSVRKEISKSQVEFFCQKVIAVNPDSVVITGDISTANGIELHLSWLERYLPGVPVYFVLGNHDYYNGSINGVRSAIAKYNGTKTRTGWLNVMKVVKLTERTALVGHDGWYDGGYSNWFKSNLCMNDYFLTNDFMFQPRTLQYQRILELATECGHHIDRYVHEAASKGFQHVLFATHVPPFRENSRAPDGSLSDEDWLPNMSSKIAGDALLKAAKAFPRVKFTCLSGHTHTAWEQTYRPNLTCITGNAKYGDPSSSLRLIEVE